jgi:hypothetical protein
MVTAVGPLPRGANPAIGTFCKVYGRLYSAVKVAVVEVRVTEAFAMAAEGAGAVSVSVLEAD